MPKKCYRHALSISNQGWPFTSGGARDNCIIEVVIYLCLPIPMYLQIRSIGQCFDSLTNPTILSIELMNILITETRSRCRCTRTVIFPLTSSKGLVQVFKVKYRKQLNILEAFRFQKNKRKRSVITWTLRIQFKIEVFTNAPINPDVADINLMNRSIRKFCRYTGSYVKKGCRVWHASLRGGCETRNSI